MKTKFRTLIASCLVASVAFIGAMGNAMAGDEWFVLGEQQIQTANPSVTIKSQGSRWDKDVKQVKLSVDGADVEISKVVLAWDNRPDDTLTDVGTLKSGGETAPNNAPGMKGRLKSATIHYKILGGAPSANLKVMGYD